MTILDSFLQNVRRTVLPNRLTLLTLEQRGTGIVAINTWVKAGYFHEPDEVAGMAHLFEHMFFKGSEKFPGAEEIAQHVSRLGGMTNAGTIYDSTNYYFVLPREGFAKAVEIQADAILHPLFDPDELKKEAEVVIEESNRKFDNPSAVATERMYATAFTEHRMKRWRIGSNEVLRSIQGDHLRAFFETLYRPENIIVSIVGDVSHEEAEQSVAATFGQLPVGTLRKERGPQEPVQMAFRYGESLADIKQSYSVLGWHTPGEHHQHEEALEVLATILGGGRYSRLYRRVVGPDAASTVTAFNSVFEEVGMFTIRTSYEDDHLGEVEKRIIAELETLKLHGPTHYEVELAKNRIEAGFVFELEDVLGQAQTLCHFESRGSFEDIRDYLTKIRSLSPVQVSEVVNRYLRSTNLTLYRYRPKGSAASVREKVEETLSTAAAKVSGAPSPVDLPHPSVAIAGAEATRAIQRFVLSNGITLFVKENRGTPTVSTSVHFRGGRLHEHSRNAGITQLMARSMRRGTTTRSDEQIDREIEFLGTQIGISVEEDFLSFGVEILRSHYRSGIEILSDVLNHPTFPPSGVEEERHLQLASIKRALDSSGERPFQLFYEAFYGNHPYALPAAGFATVVDTLDAPALGQWYEENIVADGALIVVAGDVLAEEIRDIMEKSLGGLRKSVALRPPVPLFVAPEAQRHVVEVRDRKQTAIVAGFPTIPPNHPDWIVLRVIQDITSGLAGTFFIELRSKRSLAYTVFAGDSSRENAGAFVGYIATENSKETEAREGLLREIRRLGDDGVTEEDLERAKLYIAGTMKIRLQTNAALASEIAQNYLYRLGLDFTERFLDRVRLVTLQEIRAVAKNYLSHDNYTVAILRGRG